MTRTQLWRFALILGLSFSFACGGRSVGGDAGGGSDAGPGVDSGMPGVDSGMPGVDSGPGVDAGPPDAGPPPCACPAFPASCTAPAANAPTFTPDAEAMVSQLFDVIACADTTLRIAVYEADWDCIANAIDTQLARDPDLVVEIVVDDDICAIGSCFADTLTPADRVTVVRDNRSGFMHHKFVIADDARLWVSSANFTYNSFCGDHNDAIVVEQPEIVARYGAIFTRMFVDNQFGPVSAEGATTGGDHTVYFSPESPVASPPEWFNQMVTTIEAATTSIDIMTNAWTRTEISDAVIAALGRGVLVRAVVSHLYADDAPAQALLAAGIDIRRDNIHDKVLIVDGTTVVTGSANWSANAWSNNENSLWITNPSVAAAFQAEFDLVYGAARPVTAP